MKGFERICHPCYGSGSVCLKCGVLHWCTESAAEMLQSVSAGVSHLLTGSLDFQLRQGDARMLMRDDAWPQSVVDCKVVSYTEKKKGVKNASTCGFATKCS